jgi:hypothetical protein
MAYLNANIPVIYCQVRKEYLYDMRKGFDETVDCVIFGVTSIAGRAILFNIMLPNGACYWRLPISAFIQKGFDRKTVPDMPLDELELWNCFSYHISVHQFDFLGSQKGKYLGKNKKFYKGHYLFTLDWASPDGNILDCDHSEIPQEHKCAHILELDNGNFAAQPNNRILWNVPNFTVSSDWPDYKVQSSWWNVENTDWITEDTDNMFYGVEDKDKEKEIPDGTYRYLEEKEDFS